MAHFPLLYKCTFNIVFGQSLFQLSLKDNKHKEFQEKKQLEALPQNDSIPMIYSPDSSKFTDLWGNRKWSCKLGICPLTFIRCVPDLPLHKSKHDCSASSGRLQNRIAAAFHSQMKETGRKTNKVMIAPLT